VSTLRIELDQATDEALATLAASRGKAPADLVAEWVSRYVKIYEPLPNGHDDRRKVAAPADPDPLAPLVKKHLGWEPDDPRLVNRRRDPLDAIVGSAGDAEPVDDIDEVIYGP
jgi:hypothetical protein